MGFFDFLWGSEKKREAQDASSGYVPMVSDEGNSDPNDSSGAADVGGETVAGVEAMVAGFEPPNIFLFLCAL